MLDYKTHFHGKKITIMGLGLLGRGVGDVEFLAACGAELIVTDLKTKKELAPSLRRLRKYPKITYVLGKHRLEDFRNQDMILKAAGVPLDSPYVAKARKHRIPIEMDASLFMRLAPEVTFIGVTGTRGKSTTTQLIYQILKKHLGLNRSQKRTVGPRASAPGLARKTLQSKVFLGGNVQGVATLPLLAKVHPGDFVVAELDSWQLQGFGDANLPAGKAGMSPPIAVFTNFMPDHLNYYRGSMQKYWDDKVNIFKWQKEGDVIVCGEGVSKRIKTRGDKIIARTRDIPKSWKLLIPGVHNRENAASAYHVGKILGVKESVIRTTLEHFKGVPGRLELVRTWRGVEVYNDTTSTTPNALIAALETLGRKKKNVVLIAGGTDKNLEYGNAAQSIKKYVKAIIFFPGTATEKMKKLLPRGFEYTKVKSMKEGLKQAVICSAKGDVILLSPCAASFGLFKNEYDRGEQFNREVRKLS